MEQKYILSEEDIRNLPVEQQREYNNFLDTIRDKGVVYRAQLQKFDEILQQQYRSGVLFNPNSLERYPEILAKNINNIIDTIIQVRNDVINEKKQFQQFNFEKIEEGLDELRKFVETKKQSPHYQKSLGYKDLESLLPRIDQIKDQILKDIKFYQGYHDEKQYALINYERQKRKYDKSSLFGKLAARVNGEKAKLDEATRDKMTYDGIASIGTNEPGVIINPNRYDEYIERQLSDNQPTVGMKR